MQSTVERPARMPRIALPPAGPAWYASIMGTGILSSLLHIHAPQLPGANYVAIVLLAVSWVLLLGVSGCFLRRIIADSKALTSTLRDATVLPLWGTVSMAILSIESATFIVVPSFWPQSIHAVIILDMTMWVIGTTLGWLTALGFVAVLVHRDLGPPTTVWGLPVVPPMVSATTGSALIPFLHSDAAKFIVMVLCAACFFFALFLASIIFSLCYRHHWGYEPPSLVASASAWIPLGIVGQSTAAAQAMAAQAEHALIPAAATTAHEIADIYGFGMMLLGVPLIIYATAATVRGFQGKMPFTTGWWAMTFPIGTLSLGCYFLGTQTNSEFFSAAGLAFCLVLVCTWTICTVATLRALYQSKLAH